MKNRPVIGRLTTGVLMGLWFPSRPVTGFVAVHAYAPQRASFHVCGGTRRRIPVPAHCYQNRALFASKASNYNHSKTVGSPTIKRTKQQRPDQKQRLFPEEINIIYDSKCNVCKLEIDFLRNRDLKLAHQSAAPNGQAQPKLRFTDIEDANYNPNDPANGGVTYERGMKSMHAVTANGQVVNGVPVFAMAYEQVNMGWLFALTKVPFVKQPADWLYNLFAKYRTRITRGTNLDDLIQAYHEKQALEQQQQKQAAQDCVPCKDKSSN